ncbi:AraC family transcriptional regulator [Sulfurimonas sp.]|uniref:helix-turn-helix domain-containing protein n=1 Tax=Sulfurimonas sp. TaxID=2022749 RepID=UPI002B48CE12|nr:AraC family transcriptional regulator [Sulfurimonas sp.]
MCKLTLNDLKGDIFPIDIGTNITNKINIQDGFLLLKINYKLQRPIQIEAKQNSKKFVITMSLKGSSTYTNAIDKKTVPFKEGFTTISLFEKTQGFREFHDKEVEQIRLILDEDFLQRNLQKSLLQKYFINSDKYLNLISFSPTLIQSQIIITEILDCQLQGELKKIYLQSKSLELLHVELSKLGTKENKILLDNYDKTAIYKAKEILINNMENPPSIVDLAKQVHMNEFKLKVGFKKIFHTSPYKLLLKYKMNEAKIMLHSGEYNINEVAKLIGYKYASNFTNAFMKEFGLSPKSYIP